MQDGFRHRLQKKEIVSVFNDHDVRQKKEKGEGEKETRRDETMRSMRWKGRSKHLRAAPESRIRVGGEWNLHLLHGFRSEESSENHILSLNQHCVAVDGAAKQVRSWKGRIQQV